MQLCADTEKKMKGRSESKERMRDYRRRCVDRHENIFLYTHAQIALRPIFMKRTTCADEESVKMTSRRGIFWNVNPLNVIYNFEYCFLKTETMNTNRKVCVRMKTTLVQHCITVIKCFVFTTQRTDAKLRTMRAGARADKKKGSIAPLFDH